MLTNPGAPDATIRAALRGLPSNAGTAGLGKIACQVEPIADGLRLTADMALAPQGGEETVVFEARDPAIWVSEAQSSRRGDNLRATAEFVANNGAPFALDRSGVTVTVLHEGGSIEIAGCPAP